MTDTNRDRKPDIPTGTDELAPDASEAKRATNPDRNDDAPDRKPEGNPPRTTTGKHFTAPKFGSAGSGGLELEPGLDKD